MPTNLYEPHDNYDLKNSHVIPALIRKVVEAKKQNLATVEIWGTGSPLREFLHVDDVADACFFLMKNYSALEFVNVGSGHEITIKDLALLIKKITGYTGELKFDTTKPNGTPRKLMDNSKLSAMGWSPKITLEQGLMEVTDEYFRSASINGK